jgi:hypothetical protein
MIIRETLRTQDPLENGDLLPLWLWDFTWLCGKGSLPPQLPSWSNQDLEPHHHCRRSLRLAADPPCRRYKWKMAASTPSVLFAEYVCWLGFTCWIGFSQLTSLVSTLAEPSCLELTKNITMGGLHKTLVQKISGSCISWTENWTETQIAKP